MRKRVTGNDVYVDDNAIMYVTNSVHTIISTSTSACIASPLSSFLDAQPQSPETAVHLQIIKVLLTAVTTPTCEVHEMSLLKCLQACVNICTYSKNPVNQATARAVCEAAGVRNDCVHVSSIITLIRPQPHAYTANRASRKCFTIHLL